MALSINLNGDGIWANMLGKVFDAGHLIEIGCLPRGMTSGRPSVAIRLKLEDGSYVFAQCSMREFLAAADAMRARFAEEL